MPSIECKFTRARWQSIGNNACEWGRGGPSCQIYRQSRASNRLHSSERTACESCFFGSGAGGLEQWKRSLNVISCLGREDRSEWKRSVKVV